jgi:hypothetical protein
MKKADKKIKQKTSPEQVSPEEALKRMKSFSERKEKFVASIRPSQN